MEKLKMIILTLIVTCLIFSDYSSLYAEDTLTLQIHPYLPSTELTRRFTPLANYLGQKIEQPVTIRIAKNYQEHIDQVGRDKVDIAYMGPASFVKLIDTYGKKPILARLEINGKPTFRGAIITAKNSSLQTLSDLKEYRFAFGDPNSTMSHLVPRFMLKKAGVDINKLAGYKFLYSHHNVALGVLIGDFDAGAVKEEIFYKYKDRGLKVLAWTPAVSEHVFIASNSLPEKTVRALRNALYNLKDDEKSAAIMSAIKNNMTAMISASDKDYDNLRIILQTLEKGVNP
ncbi:MAG: phosphate/phosphite/phosphonate ABC transporter substrate-binding protein [Nitrospirota bacterium]